MSDDLPDRARAFVPGLIPEPKDIKNEGPLSVREQRDLQRIHDARDNHLNAAWMRGKSLEAAFRRSLYRGDDGTRTRQEYLDDEWDGISESAAYLEIKEWRLAEQIATVWGRPAPDSHVRALVGVAAQQDPKTVAQWYAALRERGAETRRRVTAGIVTNLATYLAAEGTSGSPELDWLFVRQLTPKHRKSPGQEEEPAQETDAQDQSPFQKIGMDDHSGTHGASSDGPAPWVLGTGHVAQLSTYLATEAEVNGISPDQAAELLMQALYRETSTVSRWLRAGTGTGRS
ncbi:hypothetical protein [Streptomyces sp. NPDC087294]|uniref:hypothetical protein n=1 Tax=Streptomyces sp. NPDC087294 TaxID=3365777 RepID=UPI0038012B9F